MSEDVKVSEKPSEPKPPTSLPVAVVQITGPTALVEWCDGETPMRGYIPLKEVREDGTASLRALRAAVPYGAAWAKYAREIKFSPEQVEAALKSVSLYQLHPVPLL